MKISEILIIVIVLVLISIAFFVVMDKGLSGYEIYECQKWQAEATTYQGYFVTGWQQAQCNHYHIEIDAPVQK